MAKGRKQVILASTTVAHDISATNTTPFDISDFDSVLLTFSITNAFTGGSTPGITFTLEIDTTGNGDFVAASTLIATAVGFSAAAPADLTLTSTGKGYRFFRELAGHVARVKYATSGTPTGGTATIAIAGYLRRE